MIARTYAELCDAFVARLTGLNVQHLELDHACGLATGYTGKLLGPKPTKHYGPRSLDLHLQALGLMLIVAPDIERMPMVSDSREFRPKDAAAATALRKRKREGRELLAEILRDNRQKHRKKMLAGYMKLPASKRRRIARNAALKRWRAALNAIAAQ
jgi:hypothetical protein